MLNAYEHPDADRLTRSVEQALPQIEGLIEPATDADGVLTVYANDNFGSWNSNRDEPADGARGPLIVIPRDAVASIHEDLAAASLKMMELNMDAEVVDAADVRF